MFRQERNAILDAFPALAWSLPKETPRGVGGTLGKETRSIDRIASGNEIPTAKRAVLWESGQKFKQAQKAGQ